MIYKAKGKVSDLEQKTINHDCSGTLGIAHTRWATYDIPYETNAHPHTSQTRNIILVHNGIIENYTILKEQLQQKDYSFETETDTEVLVQLIQYTIDTVPGGQLDVAVRHALKKMIGAYAIVAIDAKNPSQLVVSRNGRILAIVGEDDEQVKGIAKDVIEIPQTINCLVPLLSIIPLQLLSYHIAVEKGLDVD